MKKIAIIFCSLVSLGGCKSYKPEVMYELYIRVEDTVGSITLYLPTLTYKGKPVKEILGFLQDDLEKKKEKDLKDLRETKAEYEAEYEERLEEREKNDFRRKIERISEILAQEDIWWNNIKLEFVDTKYGKMLKVYFPVSGYDKWRYECEGRIRLPYGAKSCKKRTALDDFRINPCLKEIPLDDQTKKYTRIYADFDQGTVTVFLKIGIIAQYGEEYPKKDWPLFEQFFPLGVPWVIELEDFIWYHIKGILTKKGWHTLPAVEKSHN